MNRGKLVVEALRRLAGFMRRGPGSASDLRDMYLLSRSFGHRL